MTTADPAPGSLVRFSQDDVAVFLAYSRDRNPLHWDGAYAHRTPFGRIVVPGMCGVLAGLGRWGAGRDVRIYRIQGTFRRPLFLDEDYRVTTRESAGATTIVLAKGGTTYTEVSVCHEPSAPPVAAVDGPEYRRDAVRYEPDPAFEEALVRTYDLSSVSLRRDHLSALGWASQCVGMEYPGASALFSSFDIVFDPSAAPDAELRFTEIAGRLDDRFQRTTTVAYGQGGVRQCLLHAFVRPDPPTHSTAAIAAASAGSGQAFFGKSVVVAGGSRGFGAVLTRMFLQCGSRVVFSYNKAGVEAQAIEEEALQQGWQAYRCQADLTAASDCARLGSHVRRILGGLDVLVHNAAPPIRAQSFVEQGPSELNDFLLRSMGMMSQASYVLLPLMNPGGLVVTVSSIYVREPRPLFSHYVCYKSAAEGLTRALATEFPALQFVIARPPRLATDQTNLPFAREPAASPVPIAATLIHRLATLPSSEGNVHEIDLA